MVRRYSATYDAPRTRTRREARVKVRTRHFDHLGERRTSSPNVTGDEPSAWRGSCSGTPSRNYATAVLADLDALPHRSTYPPELVRDIECVPERPGRP